MALIKTVQTRVSLYCSCKGPMRPINFVAEVLCELVGIDNGIKRAEDAANYPKLVEIVSQISAVAKKHDYSKEGFLQMISNLFLADMSLNQMKDLVKGSIIVSYPESLDGNMSFSYISEYPPVLRKITGSERYVPIERPIPTQNRTIHRLPQHSNLDPDPLNSIEVIGLKQFYESIRKEEKRYFWEWEVTTEQYNKLKELLLKVHFESQQPKVLRYCAPQIALYIAEWYKREYDGYNSSNSLEEIGLDSSKSQMIWDNANLKQEDLFCTDDTNVHQWLYSMYLLGGFPIKYTNRSNRFSSLFDAIWGEDKEKDSISNEQVLDITQGFDGSQTVRNSLISGSLHDYYRYLRVQEDMPIADDDKNIEPFKTFIKHLKEGQNNFFKNYIRANWYLYIDPQGSTIESTFRVTFGRKDDKCYIPSECLEYWKIPHSGEVKDFWIAVAEPKLGIQEKIRFSKTGIGDRPYVGWTRRNMLDLDVPYSKDVSIEVNLIVNNETYPIHEPFKVEDSHQFYKTDSQYEWSDRTDNHSWTSVLYNPLVFSSDNPSLLSKEKTTEGDSQEWIWLPLSEEVSLTDKEGNSVNYTPHNHLLSISFKLIKNTVKYVNFRNLTYRQIIDGDVVESQIPLLKKDGLSVSFIPFGSAEEENIPLNKCQVFFKQDGDDSFVLWDGNNEPRQGITKINVSYPEKSISTTTTVFYLPSATPFTRNVNKGSIVFASRIKDIYFPTNEGYSPLKPIEGSLIYCDNLETGYDLQSDTIPFIVGNPATSYALVNIYRARKCKELYLNGESEPIVRYTDSTGTIDIPFILRDKFSIRIIDDNGVRRTNCGENIHLGLNNTSRLDRDNNINYYRYKSHGTSKRCDIKLETNSDQYRFYYWSTRPDEMPIPVLSSFDTESKILRLNLSPLHRNERGMVFQSLRGVTPRHYFAPIYGREFSMGKYSFRQECFDIATYHKIPFQLFPPLKELYNGTSLDSLISDSPSSFAKQFFERKMWSLSNEDCKNLNRFANEFCFDWLLIPRWRWFKIMIGKTDKKCQDTLKSLFRSSSRAKSKDKEYLERIIDVYWRLPSRDKWNVRRSPSLANIAMQCMRGVRSDIDIITLSNNIEQLEAVQEYDGLYEELYKTIATIKVN